MMQFRMACVMLLFVCTSIVGCGGAVSPREPQELKDKVKDLVPLTGQVTVGGAPAADIGVAALNETDLSKELAMRSGNSTQTLAANGSVAPDGKFGFTTRVRNDGLLPGNYIILFTKVIENGVSNPQAERFNSQYGNPETSTYKVTLEKGKPHDMGKIELKAP